MDNWEKYYHSDDKDLLVQLAIIHAQSEINHPFLDGNGRIGRVIFPLFLYEKQLLSRPLFYLSEYLENNRDEYVGSLRQLNGGDTWLKRIEFFLRAIDKQARINTQKVKDMLKLYQELKSDILEITRSQYAVPLLDRYFHMPIILISEIMKSRQCQAAKC